MSKFFTQWDDATIGDNPPAGWSRRWTAASSPSNHATELAYGSMPVKRRQFNVSNVSTNGPAMLSYDAVDSAADVEILALVKRHPTAGSTRAILYARGSGVTASFNAYVCDLGWSDSAFPNTIALVKYVAGAGTSLASTSYTPSTTKAYYIRFQVQSTTVRARVWAEDETEPTTWTVSATDSAVSGAGWHGVQALGDGGGTKTLYVNFFSVGTSGDVAVNPKTNAEFSSWLNVPNERRWLVEMTGKGYDSGGSPFTKTVNAYVANGGYVSSAWDSPASQFYRPIITKVPTIRREMALALSDNATASFGSFTVTDPREVSVGPGVRDDWTRIKWNRDYVRVLLGAPSWPRHDFRTQILGRLGMPRCPSVGEIEFPISDLLASLDVPIPRTVYGAGTPLEGQPMPLLVGFPRWSEPVPTSTTTLEQQLNGGPIASIADVYDDGVSLTVPSPGVISAVDTVTDTITSSVAHGLAVDMRVQLTGGSPPSGLSIGVFYFVIAAGLTATDFRLSSTRGGGAINLTSATLGADWFSYGWWEDLANGKFTLTGNPAGRIMVVGVAQQSNSGTLNSISPVLDRLIFTTFGISANFKDSGSFATLLAALPDYMGKIWHEKVTALAALDELCRRTNCWYGFTPDGLLQVGRLALPAATAVLELTESDVKDGSMSREQLLIPIDRETLQVLYNPHQVRTGPLSLAPNKFFELLTPYATQVGSAWPAAGIPLDDRPNQADVKDYPPFDTLFTSSSSDMSDESDRLESFYAKMLGVFKFETRLAACELSIGQTIQLTHSRLGWKQWTGSDDASPDNTADVDSTKAVVIGISTDLNKADGFPVKLTVFRQVPGYYPIADLT